MRIFSFFLLVLLFIIGSCKKDNIDPLPIILDSNTLSFTAVIDGELYTATSSPMCDRNKSGPNDSLAPSYYIDQYVYLTNGSSSGGWSTVAIFHTLQRFSSPPDSSEYDGMFHLGSYRYERLPTWSGFDNSNMDTTTSPVVHLQVYHYNSDGSIDLWRSDNSSLNSFEIISIVLDYSAFECRYIVSGTFSCTLYDISGNTYTLTNGKFNGQIGIVY